MQNHLSPSQVMYNGLKACGISNQDAARTLLKDSSRVDGHDRSYTSRNFVNVEPGQLFPSDFASFEDSAYSLTSMIASKGKGRASWAAIQNHFATDAAAAMCQSLEAYGMDSNLYLNAVRFVNGLDAVSRSDKAMLLVLLYVATGCLGDPRQSVPQLQACVDRSFIQGFRTSEVYEGQAEEIVPSASVTTFALVRSENGKIKLPPYQLSTSEEGTVIGSMAMGPSSITDVGPDVSRIHARIWLHQGQWCLKGLDSKNGVSVIRGADQSLEVVELPRSDRGLKTSKVVQLQAGDTICLGASTRFVVWETAL